jgi:hypothetical protein
MSWEKVLKTRRRKKVNMDHLRKIVDHLLPNMGDEFTIEDFHRMVVTTYLHYNPTKRSMNLKSILGNMLKNRGYQSNEVYTNNIKNTVYRKL